MSLSFSTATPDDVEELSELDGRNFGYTVEPDMVERVRDNFDLSRFVVARDGDIMVAAAGNFSLEVTLPGPAPVPMAGVTWVSVATTHRRSGIASELMARLEQDASSRGEPVIGLGASEGGIYERFGYGPATSVRITSIDRQRVQLTDDFRVDTSTIRLVDHTKHYDEICDIFDRYRRQRVGEVSFPSWLAREMLQPEKSSRQVCALHPDGFAIWAINPDWNDGDPRHQVRIWMLAAVTDEAYRALWSTILSIDLVGEISSRVVTAPDEPLPYFLTNPRALKTTHVGDHLWLKVLDPVAAFGARRYRTDDEFVVELADGRRLRIANDAVTEVETDPADLSLSESAAGPLLLGGVSASNLAAGHRLVPSSPDVLDRADAFFGVSPLPHCQVGF